MGGEVVHHDVELDIGGVATADVFQKGEYDRGVFLGSQHAPQLVGADVVGTEEIADTHEPPVGGPGELGFLLAGPARPRPGTQRDRPTLVEANQNPIEGSRLCRLVDPGNPGSFRPHRAGRWKSSKSGSAGR